MSNKLAAVDPRWAWEPYVPTAEQPWNLRRAAHLYRRAGFGASPQELAAAVSQSPEQVVRLLVEGEADPAEEQQASDALAQTILATGNTRQLSAWWLYVMLRTRRPLIEKMTLFWHGHFATSGDKVTDAATMLDQNRLLRKHALGNFRQLAQEISRDPAMLIYLDSVTNRKVHPNENYARELMELFCLGEGHYSEKDVQELARCFTGWEIRQNRFRFNRFQHDSGPKTILGKTDLFAEGAAIDWIVDQPQSHRFIAGKLFRALICDEPEPPAELLEPLAEVLRASNWDLAPAIERILGSQLFFSPYSVGRKVRSPVDLVVGLLRSLEGSANTQQLSGDVLQIGQGLFYPPNVKGWDGGRAWINASSILNRANLAGRLLTGENTRFGGVALGDYFARQGWDTSEKALGGLDELLLAAPLTAAARARLLQVAAGIQNPNQSATALVTALASLPEFQLS